MDVLREMLEQIERQRRNKMLSEAPDQKAMEIRYLGFECFVFATICIQVTYVIFCF